MTSRTTHGRTTLTTLTTRTRRTRRSRRTRCAAVVVGLLTAGAPLLSGASGLIYASAEGSVATGAAGPSTYLVVTGGRTALALDPRTAGALEDNGVTIAPASEARVVKAGIAFPVSGGLLDRPSLAGTVDHTGGLTFAAGGKRLTVRDFTIDTGARRLTAYADQAGVGLPLLSLRLGRAAVSATRTRLVVARLPVTLSPRAAQTLNSYFSTDLFAGGLRLGTVRLDATVKTLRS